ncbi:FMN-binding protein [Clostridium sp.]|uniref:FMN-binding protein n=1 Tax=Clostridium sp. TaxID=1506 RepID=UPI002623D92B|nr:FMN-binding protein [Clostridium sp.]
MMKSKKFISLVTVAALASTILVGCGAAKETGLKNGNYEAKSEKDERGYVASINIEVKDGKIATVKFDEANDAGSKLQDVEYNTKMEAVSGINPIKAYPDLETALVEKQDVDAVDTVTGATNTSDTFKALAKKALETAK